MNTGKLMGACSLNYFRSLSGHGSKIGGIAKNN
jgi:hypothetical protein